MPDDSNRFLNRGFDRLLETLANEKAADYALARETLDFLVRQWNKSIDEGTAGPIKGFHARRIDHFNREGI